MMSLLLITALITFTKAASNLTAVVELFSKTEIIKIFDDVDADLIKMEIEGPAGKWVGIGFNGTDMNNTYAIICTGAADAGTCQENILGYGNPGVELKPTIKVLSSVEKNGVRYVELERKRMVDGAGYFEFPSAAGSVPVIASIGTTNYINNATSGMAIGTVSTMTFTAP
eukprot:UN00733